MEEFFYKPMASAVSNLKRLERVGRINAGKRAKNVADAYDERLRVNGLGLSYHATKGYRLASDRLSEEVAARVGKLSTISQTIANAVAHLTRKLAV